MTITRTHLAGKAAHLSLLDVPVPKDELKALVLTIIYDAVYVCGTCRMGSVNHRCPAVNGHGYKQHVGIDPDYVLDNQDLNRELTDASGIFPAGYRQSGRLNFPPPEKLSPRRMNLITSATRRKTCGASWAISFASLARAGNPR